MKRLYAIVGLVFSILLLATNLAYGQNYQFRRRSSLNLDYEELPQRLPTAMAKLAGQNLKLSLARSRTERAKGLMFYDKLGDNEGMLFVYPIPEMMSFWMRNTKIPLDIVFFDGDLTVTEWIKNMRPGYGKHPALLPHYKTKFLAQYALELNVGSVEKFGIKVGQKLEIPSVLLYSED